MAGETLGTARLLLTVDTADFEAQVARSKNAAAGLGAEAEDAFGKLSDRAKRAATGLGRLADSIGRSAEEQKIFNALAAGVPVELVNAYIGKINERRTAIEATTTAARELATAEAAAASARVAAEASGAESALALRKAAENDQLREQQRVVAVLTQQFNALEAAEAQAQDFALANAKAIENEAMREQQRVVRVLTDQFYELERAEKAAAQGDEFVKSLQQQALAIDKTRAELLELKAAELGVSEAASPFIAKLKAQEGALRSSGIAFNQYGLSAKQTSAALRQVPAQLTDIFVSLQGGQAPLTVLLQQGGQLKDVFGGVVPAARALGGAIAGLLTPFTLLGAALAAVGFGYLKGEQEAVAFNKAIINSGNRAGTTARELAALAAELDNLSGVTTASAAASLTAVVSSGQIAAENLETVARAAIAAEKATGAAIKDTVAQFVELGKDPVAAVLKLNEAQNFLTIATFEQIKALEDQGRTQDAARVATEAYADAVIQRAADVTENLGTLESAWKAVAGFAREAWDAMLDVGREQTVEEELAVVERRIKKIQDDFAKFGRGNGLIDRLRATELAESLARRSEIQEEGAKKEREQAVKNAESVVNAELIALAGISLKYNTAAEKQQRERAAIVERGQRAIAQAQELGDQKLQAQAEAAQADALRRFDESVKKNQPKGSSPRVIDNAAARAGLQELKDLLALQRGEIANDTRELEALYKARKIPVEDYYTELAVLIATDTKVQTDSINAQIALLQKRDVAGKDSIDVQRQLNTLETQRAKVLAEGAAAQRALGTEQTAYFDARSRDIKNYIEDLGLANEALQRNVNAQIAAIGMGEKEASRVQELDEVYRDLELTLIDLERQRGEIDPVAFEAQVAAEREFTAKRVAIIKRGYAEMDAAQADWLNGISAGVADWLAENENVANQIANITGNALDTITDGLADAVATGKLLWKDLLADILKQLSAFFLKQAVVNFIKLAAGQGDPNGGFFSQLLSAVGTAVTGTAPGTNSVTPGKFSKAPTLGSIPNAMTAPGKLGAKSAGGNINLSVTTTIAQDGTATTSVKSDGDNAEGYKQLTNNIRQIVVEEVTKSTRQGGALWRMGVGQK